MTGAVFAAAGAASRRTRRTSCRSSSTTPPTRTCTAAPPRCEILRDTEGRLDAFVAGVGTGGTITGVGEVLKAKLPGVHIVAVEPARSPVLGGGKAGIHGIQGIGASFVPGVLNRDVYDELIAVKDEDAFAMTAPPDARRRPARRHLAGANVWASLQVATQARRRQARRDDAAGYRRALPERKLLGSWIA